VLSKSKGMTLWPESGIKSLHNVENSCTSANGHFDCRVLAFHALPTLLANFVDDGELDFIFLFF
jgi:hypothetical protein